MTFSIPTAIKKRAQARRDVNWSAVVAGAISDRLAALEITDRLLAKSKLTPRDVDELAKSINAGISRRLGLAK